MPDTLTVKTSGVPVIGEKQAQYFAISIFSDVKTYIKEHWVEFESWQKEQDGEASAI